MIVKQLPPPHSDNVEFWGNNSDTLTFSQPFKIGSDHIIESTKLQEFSQLVDSLLAADSISRVNITGLSSIDGPAKLNYDLSKARAKAMAKWIETNTDAPISIITVASKGEDWALFNQLVEADVNIPDRNALLDILSMRVSASEKEKRIRRLAAGRTWKYLAREIFPKMRCAEVELDMKHRFFVQIPVDTIVEDKKPEEEASGFIIASEDVEMPEESVYLDNDDFWIRKFYIKTNLPYWLMSWSNIAFEVDLAPHWSFNLPIYFSAVNYFKSTIKFRTFSFQPGFRYWLKEENRGVYLEAHYGMGWWNFAFNGDYRYQDHFRKTPTMGGGIAAGYRMPVSKNGRWSMEFGAGVGVYRLCYDRFQNRPNGKLIDSHRKTVFFIDNLNISISYSLPIEKKRSAK